MRRKNGAGKRQTDVQPEPVRALDAMPAPESVQVAPRHLRICDMFAASFAVTGFPSEVGAGWLEPLLTYPGRLDVSVHIEPIETQVAAERLRRQRARFESGRRADFEKGRLADPYAEAAAEDATELAYRLARGEGRLFRVGLYLTVYAGTEKALAEQVSAVRSLAAGLLLQMQPTSFRALAGWTSCLPLGVDAIKLRRTFDTASLASAFPFTSPDLSPADPTDTSAPDGILYGVNAASSGLVIYDRWAQDNYNSIVLARSGAGKSFFSKLEILRSLYRGVQVLIVDPENEYERLAASVGGAYLDLGADGVRLNPFDLPEGAQKSAGKTNALLRRALFLHTFICVLLGEQLAPTERAALDRAVLAAYAAVGITADPRTWKRTAPILSDLTDALRTQGTQEAANLAARLEPFTTGSWAGLFDGPTTTAPSGHLQVFCLRHLPDELKTVGTLLVLDTVWRQVTSIQRRRRLVVVDEAWLLMREPEGARFLLRMAKAARKWWAGLAVITQDTADVLATDLGRAVVANASTQILLRQAPQALDAVADAFHLSAGERDFLATAPVGTGLLAAGEQRVAFTAVASDTEYAVATTNPADLVDEEPDGYFDPDQDHAPEHADSATGQGPIPAFSTADLDDSEGVLL
ncbi:VirB4 family type IV secretion system protein [Catenulispora pinisilvae]|uniref:VirB4 family type IV secretion system protein n=1 Tax=Catenulispora pinisilvae TaxID=2705253 RepID=UPI001891DA24|nr:ATP-binding protein [Catenulispora pinisilvae]